ncbi:MAG: NUDIX hydrolase [Candidatus Curtissbacteria bacterium]
MKQKTWKRLSTKVVFENKWMKVRLDHVINPLGEEGEFGIIEKNDYGLIIPKISNKFCMVNEYRITVDARSWAFPQGHFETGADKSVEANARRELKEETGLIANGIEYLSQLYLAPGFCTQKFSVYIANDCRQDQTKRDRTESDMEVGLFEEDELKRMVRDGEVRDAPTVAAFGLYLLHKK